MKFSKWSTTGKEKEKKNGAGKIFLYLQCECECGRIRFVNKYDLISGKSKSCGCLTRNKKHGASETKVYSVWEGMKKRCLNKNDKRFKDYGGRGIGICKEWLSFENFSKDIGPRPDGYQIDRIDNDGDYNPSNCRWATRQENSSNKRNSQIIEFNGRKETLSEWSRLVGVRHSTLEWRIKKWGIKKALTTKKMW